MFVPLIPVRWLQHWFLVGLVLCFALGSVAASHLATWADQKIWQHLVVAAVMFCMALPIEFAVVRGVLQRPLAPLLASSINLGLAPLCVWPWLAWSQGELALGFAVLAATPCTLASAAVWTRRAGGNEVVAVMVTLLTNLASCWLLPAWLAVLTTRSAAGPELGSIVGLLWWIVVVPILLAQVARRIPRVQRWAVRRQPWLSVFCQLGILSIVLVGAVKMALRLAQAHSPALGFPELLGCGVLALGLHGFMFYCGIRSAHWLRLPRGEQWAVGFSGSQKTLMVGLTVAIELGFSIIPLVMYHVLQLIADTLLADYLRRRYPPAGMPAASIVPPGGR